MVAVIGLLALLSTFAPRARRGMALLDSESRDVLRAVGATVAYTGHGEVIAMSARNTELYWATGEVRITPKEADGRVTVDTPHGQAVATGPLLVTVTEDASTFTSERGTVHATCFTTLGWSTDEARAIDGVLHCP